MNLRECQITLPGDVLKTPYSEQKYQKCGDILNVEADTVTRSNSSEFKFTVLYPKSKWLQLGLSWEVTLNFPLIKSL